MYVSAPAVCLAVFNKMNIYILVWRRVDNSTTTPHSTISSPLPYISHCLCLGCAHYIRVPFCLMNHPNKWIPFPKH